MKSFPPGTLAVMVTLQDGSVAIHRVVLEGRGNVLPFRAHWLRTSHWYRPGTDEVIERSLSDTFASGLVVSWKRVKENEIPQDREFRNAWRAKDGKIEHDMSVAKELKRATIRHERAKAFPSLDARWHQAMGRKNEEAVATVEALRQQWRDAPADPRIDAAQSVEDLKAIALPD